MTKPEDVTEPAEESLCASPAALDSSRLDQESAHLWSEWKRLNMVMCETSDQERHKQLKEHQRAIQQSLSILASYQVAISQKAYQYATEYGLRGWC